MHMHMNMHICRDERSVTQKTKSPGVSSKRAEGVPPDDYSSHSYVSMKMTYK